MDTRTLPHVSSPEAPKYWTNETGGRLARAMIRYLNRELPAPGDNDLVRAYLSQWVNSPVWDANPHLSEGGREMLRLLRDQVKGLRRRADLDRYIEELIDLGMDPL